MRARAHGRSPPGAAAARGRSRSPREGARAAHERPSKPAWPRRPRFSTALLTVRLIDVGRGVYRRRSRPRPPASGASACASRTPTSACRRSTLPKAGREAHHGAGRQVRRGDGGGAPDARSRPRRRRATVGDATRVFRRGTRRRARSSWPAQARCSTAARHLRRCAARSDGGVGDEAERPATAKRSLSRLRSRPAIEPRGRAHACLGAHESAESANATMLADERVTPAPG